MKKQAVLNTKLPSETKVNNGVVYRFIKRFLDFFLSLIAILIFSPFLLILFLVQLCASNFHPIFPDKRVGKGGKIITVYKFRSMYYDAEKNIDSYLTPEQKEIWIRERKLDNDPRITKFGKFLRKTSLDELPQLFNILIGTMSIVGPRPMSEREIQEHFTEQERNILFLARPGLTGYWQVNGRNEIDFKSGERQKLELEYFGIRSLWVDIKIFFKTFAVVLSKKGAK